jgi:ATP-dependent Clp protease ATP-binding subunit ClpC
VSASPHCLLLLDEIDKASPAVHDLLLHIFDDGRLSDAHGRVASFADVVVVATANFPVKPIPGFTAEGRGPDAQARTDSLRHNLRPELMARIDEVIPLAPLNEEAMREVCELHLAELQDRWLQFDVAVSWSEGVPTHLLSMRSEVADGVRSLIRSIDHQVTDRVIEAVCAGATSVRLCVGAKNSLEPELAVTGARCPVDIG